MAVAGRPFVGRLEAVDALRRRADAAVAGTGGFTLLEGETGVGKSTLLGELITDLRRRGVHVLVGRAVVLESPPPYLLLRRALESASGEGRPAGELSGRRPLAFAAAARGGPSSLLGFAPGAIPADEEDIRLVEDRLLEQLGDPGGVSPTGQGGMPSFIAGWLLALAEAGPSVLVLDDLQLADEPSLEALRDLAPQLGRSSLWVLATTVPTSALPEGRRELIEEIARRSRAERVVVRPFTAAEAGEFVREVAPHTPVRDDEVTRWHSQTGGNPSFLEQLLRARARASGAGATLATAEEVASSSAPAPEFAEYLARQVLDLSEPERRVLTVAAVLGQEFPFSLLLRATGEEEERLSETVQRLVERGVLRETPEEEVVFLRGDLRDQVDQSLTAPHRRMLHRRAAEALEAAGSPDEARIYALARHYYLAKSDEKAAEYNRRAGELAARARAPAVARLHLEHALECQRRREPKDPAAELELTLELAVQLDRLGELAEAEALLRSAAEEVALSPGLPAAVRSVVPVYLARILVNAGRWEEAERLTSDLLEGPEPPTQPLTLMALHRLRGEMFYFLGRYDESLRHHDLALELARGQRNDREIAREMVRRANVLGMIPGRLDEAIEAYHIASRSLIDLGDAGETSNALLYLGVVLAQHGRFSEALAQLTSAARYAEEAHEPRRVAWALFNAADVEREMGEVARARESNRRSREILQRVGDRFGLLQTHIVEGKILMADGELPSAEVELLEAYRLVRELRTPADEVEVLLRLAELAERRGDAAQATGRVQELNRRRVERLRPDLLQDLERLRSRLGIPGEARGAPE